MKKAIIAFAIFMHCLALSVFCGCGGDMNGWHVLDLGLDIESYDSVSIEYNMLPYGNRDSEVHFIGSSADKAVIRDVYNAVDGVKYSPETYGNIDVENFSQNVVIKFTKSGEEFVFRFYSYGVTNGYFIFDNREIHKYHGDFIGLTYEKFKEFLS